MISAARFFFVVLLVLTGCHTTKKVAVSTFRVLDAPAHYIREHIDESDNGTTTTTTTTTTQVPVSDVATPGRPVTPASTAATQRHVASETRASTSAHATPRPRSDVTSHTERKTSTAPKTTSVPTTTSFPTAKPVPGKPGYVYSIDPKGGIVDVTGYKSGDKAKDPYTQQIFIVP